MRSVFAALSLCLLSACGTVVEETTPLSLVLDQFSEPQPSQRFQAAQAAKAGTLQIGFVEQNASSNLVLEHRNGAFEYWLSSDDVHLVLENGMLHGTRGLGEGLLASDLSQPLARLRAMQEGPSDRFHTYLTGNDETVTRTYRCDIRKRREITISVVGGDIPTAVFSEDCNSLDQSFENLYWIDRRNGQIVQSLQWAGPLVSAISTRIVLQ